MRPENRHGAVLGTRPAECARLAEVFEPVMNVHVHSARFDFETGAVDFLSASAHFVEPKERVVVLPMGEVVQPEVVDRLVGVAEM